MYKFKVEDFAYKSGNIWIFNGDNTTETLAKVLGQVELKMENNITIRCKYPQKQIKG